MRRFTRQETRFLSGQYLLIYLEGFTRWDLLGGIYLAGFTRWDLLGKIYSFSRKVFDKIWLIRASLCSKSVVQLMTNDSIELHTKASSSMIVKVEEVFFPSSSSMAMAM